MEKTLAKSTEDFKKTLKASERRVKDLEKMLHKEDRETSELGHLKQRLLEELDDERKTHQQQLEGLNFTMDQTRNKYQGEFLNSWFLGLFSFLAAELAQLSEGQSWR